MKHTELFSLRTGQFHYIQCSCGNGMLKLVNHSFHLSSQARQDLFELLSKAKEKDRTELPVSTPAWPENGDWQPIVSNACSN